MAAQSHETARWLLLTATASLITACAVDGGGRIVRSDADCPMNFTLTCEARRPGATTTYSNCRCVRHGDLVPPLHGH